MPAVRLSEARLEASDVGTLSVRPIRVAVASSGAARLASRKDAQHSGGLSCVRWGWCAG